MRQLTYRPTPDPSRKREGRHAHNLSLKPFTIA